jgi:hemolysin D
MAGFMRHLDIWCAAWREENRRQPTSTPKGKELEFLPAVLELQETPPSPIGRAIGFTVITLFVLAVVWSCFGKIDIVAVAQGKIVPSGHSKVIQPFETGIVRAIHVADGQTVKQGDVLIELDATESGADTDRLRNEIMTIRVEAARIRAVLDGKSEFKAPSGADQQLIALQKNMMRDQLAEHKAKLSAADLQIEQHQAMLESVDANILRLEKTIPLLSERLKALEEMLAKNYVSRTSYLELQEEHIDKVQELSALNRQRDGEIAALNEAHQNRGILESEFKQELLTQLSSLETQEKSYIQEIRKAENRTGNQKLLAPIDGVVQQLIIHTVGGVVTPAQELMIVVPEEDRLDIEAWVENKDIGFVYTGNKAEIKVEAFPFTRYGTIDGEITILSKAAVPLEEVGAVYAARVSMDKSVMQIEGKEVELSPGMNVTVEIKTGTRRLIEYFLSPILRGINESVNER